jgi:hypothetical protein
MSLWYEYAHEYQWRRNGCGIEVRGLGRVGRGSRCLESSPERCRWVNRCSMEHTKWSAAMIGYSDQPFALAEPMDHLTSFMKNLYTSLYTIFSSQLPFILA